MSWQGYLLAMPFAVMFTYFGTPLFALADSWITGALHVALVGIGVYLPVGFVLWIAAKTVLRHRRQAAVSIGLVAVVGGAAWTARSAVLVAYVETQQLPDQVSVLARVLTGFIEGALAVVLAAWFLASLDEFHQRRRELLEELAREELKSQELAAAVSQLRASLLVRARQTVAESIDALTVPAEGAPSSGEHVRSLDEVTETVARQISRDLLRVANRDSRLSLRSVVRSATAHRPFAYWGLLPTLALALIVLPMLWSPMVGVALALSTTAVALGIAVAGNHLVPRIPASGRSAAYGVAIALLLVATVIVVRIGSVMLDVSGPSADALPWLFAMNCGVLFPLIGLAAATGRTKEQILAGLHRSITQAEIRQESLRVDEARVCREIALALHGGAQARLTAARIRLRQSLDAGDVSAAREALLEARRAAELDIDVDVDDGASLPEMVADLVDAWSGVLEITTHLDVRRALGSRAVKVVHEVLVEAVNNAARHADATRIDIQMSERGDRLMLEVADNGRGFHESTTVPGLGSELLNSLAPDSWTLAPRAEGGSTLTVFLSTGAVA